MKISTQNGLTLIELLIALVLGLLVLSGIVTVFLTTQKTYRVQEGLAQVQENGRFAMQKISEDLRQMGSLGCTSKSNIPSIGNQFRHRPVYSLVDNPGNGWPTRAQIATVFSNAGMAPFAANSAYPIDTRHLMRGHECVSGACTPAQTVLAADPGVPTSMAVTVGNRVPNTDVLTLRFVTGEGLPIANRVPTGGSIAGEVTGTLPIPIDGAGSAAPLNLENNELALLSDCGGTMLFAPGSIGSNELTHTTGDGNVSGDIGGNYQRNREVRVRNGTKQFPTVSYYLQVVANTTQPGRITSALMREQNGVAQELVRGVERLDFRYAVLGGDDRVSYLTADQVQTRNGGAIACPPSAFPEADRLNVSLPGCLWSAVTAVEVSMLMNTVNDIDVPDDEPYRYHIDGNSEFTASASMPQTGMPGGNMVRRQFTAVVGLRNYSL